MQGIGVKLGNIEQVKKQFDSLLKELQNKANKNPIQISVADFSKLEKQLKDVEKKVNQSTQNISKMTAKAFSGASKGNTYDYFKSAMDKVTSGIKQSGGQIGDVLVKVDEKTKTITSATVKYTDSLGKAITEVYKLDQQWKDVNGKQVLDKVDLKLDSSTFDNNVSKQQTENYNKLNNLLTGIYDKKKKLDLLDKDAQNGEYANKLKKQIGDQEAEYKKILNTVIKINKEEETGAINQKQKNELIKIEKQLKDSVSLAVAKQNDPTLKKTSTTTSGQMNLGELVKDGINFDASKQELSEYAKLVGGAGAEWTKLTPKLVNGSQKIKEVAVRVKDGADKWQNFTMILDQSTGSLYKVDRGLSDVNTRQLSFGEQMKIATQRIVQWGASTVLVYGSLRKLKEGIEFITDMNTALTDMGKVVDLNKSQMDEMMNSAISMGKALGKSATEIAQGFAEWGRVTKDLNEIKELTRVSTLASNVTDLSVADASKALSTSMINYKLEVKDVATVLDQLNEIQNNFKASAGNIAEGLAEVGGVAYQSGVEINKMEGYLTALISSQGISGAEAGTSLRSFMSRTFRLGSEGEEDAGKTEKVLTQIGVAVRDNQGIFREFDDILDDLNGKWDTLSKNQQINVAQTIGGTHHYSKFLSLMESYSMATEASSKALNSQGSAVAENEKYLDSISGRMSVLNVETQEFFKNLISSDVIKGVVSGLSGLVNLLDTLVNKNRLLGVSIGILVTTLVLLSKTVKGIGFETYIANCMKAGIASTAMATGTTILSGVMTGLKAVISGVVTGFKFLFATPLGWITLAVTGLVFLASKIKSASQVVEEQKQKVDELSNSYNTLKTEIDNLRGIKNPTEDQKEYLALLERELDLKQQIIDQEKRKLIDKDVFGKGVWGDGMSGEVSDKVSGANTLMQDIENAKAVIKDLQDSDMSASAEFDYLKEKQAQLKEYELALIESKKKLEDYLKVADDEQRKGIEGMIGSIDTLLPKLQSENKIIQANTEANKKNAESIKDTIKSQEDLAKSFSDSMDKSRDLNKYLEELNDNHKLSGDTIADIVSKYPQLLGYIGNESALRGQLINLIGEEANVQEQLYYEMVANDQVFYETKIKNNNTAINQLAKNYNVDVANARSLAEAKLKIENGLAQAMSNIWTKYYTVLGNVAQLNYNTILDNGVDADGIMSAEAKNRLNQARKQVDSYNRQVREIASAFKDVAVHFSGVDFKGLGSTPPKSSSSSSKDAANEAEELRNQMLDNVEEVESKITEIIKAEFDKRKKAIEDEYNARRDALQKQKDLYNQQNEEDDYNKELQKEQAILTDIQNKISSARDTNTASGKARLDDLVEQAKAQQEKIDEMILQKTRDRNNDLFDLELDKLDQQQQTELDNLDKQYTEEEISKRVNEAIITGKLKAVDGSLINVLDAYKNFENTFNNGLTASGQKIQTEFIDKWQEVQKLIKGTSGVNIGINFSQLSVPKYADGGVISHTGLAWVDGTPSIPELALNGKQAVNLLRNLSVKPFTMPNISKLNLAKAVNFNQPFMIIQGDVTKDMLPDLESFVDKAKDKVTRAIMQNFNDMGIYEH